MPAVHILAGMAGPHAATQAETTAIVGPVALGWVLELFLFGIVVSCHPRDPPLLICALG